MAAADPNVERRALVGSILVTAVLGALGVVWGIASGSQVILLDGVYAVIGIVMSWLLLRASALAVEGPTRRYQYGREAVTPLVIGVQGMMLLATLLYALVEAVYTIGRGGSEVTPGLAMLYASITTIGSFATWVWIRRQSEGSDLLVAESTAWRVAALRGAGMLIGFTALLFVTDSAWDGAAPYIDPVMVIVMCVAFLSTPVRMVRGTIVELLEGAPKPEVQAPVRAVVAAVMDEHGITDPVVRMTKVGPKLYVELDAAVDASVTVGTEHTVRQQLERELGELPYDVWLNFELRPRVTNQSTDGPWTT